MNSDRFKSIIRAVVPRSARNWLRSPSRSLEWLWNSAVFSLGFTKVLQIEAGWSVVCHPQAYKIFHRAQVEDPEQAEEFQNFLSHCSKGMLLFDIGAHFGIFSLAASHAEGKAIAVDPSPTAVRMIVTEAALNNLTDSIRTVCAAVSNENGKMSLLSSGVFSDGYFKVAGSRPESELTEIPTMTIDEMVHEFGVPTHIKIDIEGHEAAALHGGRATLEKISPLLFLELHNEMIRSEGGDPNSALDELDRLGFKTYSLDGRTIDRNAILGAPLIRIVAKRIATAESTSQVKL